MLVITYAIAMPIWLGGTLCKIWFCWRHLAIVGKLLKYVN